jgi:Family of unknown function (DUF6062)
MASMSKLPARDLSAVQLAESFRAAGCPMCHHRAHAIARFMDGFLYESVNDVTFRRDLDAARGFCGPHTHALFEADRKLSGGMLGSAILLGAIMRIREQELGAAQRARGISRGRRVQDAARPATCLVCAEAAHLDEVTAGSLVRLAADAQWATALGAAEFCLQHLLAIMAAPGRPPGWTTVEQQQLERIGVLRELVAGFAHNSSHDRRHLTTPEQVAAPARAAAFLGGDPKDRSRPA